MASVALVSILCRDQVGLVASVALTIFVVPAAYFLTYRARGAVIVVPQEAS